ncbi:MAG: hypothetical protein K2X90_00045 [Candidatus Babeliaceae bacterium]|nr:hypothetical protein [Candidatus Babeliaceae bacterium]
MKLLKNNYIVIILGLMNIFIVNGMLDLMTGQIGSRNPIDLYNAGMQAVERQDNNAAIELFREAKKATAQTSEEYSAQINSLEQLINILTQRGNNESAVAKYSSEIGQLRAKMASAAGGLYELYKTGENALLMGNRDQAIKIFRDVKKALSRTMQDYSAKIKSLEELIALYAAMPADGTTRATIEKYSTELAQAYDEAFKLAFTTHDQQDKTYLKPLARALKDMYHNNGNYKDLDGRDRMIVRTPEIAHYLARDIENYMRYSGSSGIEQLKKMELQGALDSATDAFTLFNQAQKLTGFSLEELEAREKLYTRARDLFLQAIKRDPSIYNINYHLALILFKGLGGLQDVELAKNYIEKAVEASNIPVDQKKEAQELKNEIDAFLLKKEAFEKLKRVKELRVDEKFNKKKDQLERDAFKLLSQAHLLYQRDYQVEFALANMYHNAEGTEYEPGLASGSLKLARNLTQNNPYMIKEVSSLQEEIDARNRAIDLALKKLRSDTAVHEGAFAKLVGGYSRTDLAKRAYAEKLSKEPETDWMTRLFGTSKVVAKNLDKRATQVYSAANDRRGSFASSSSSLIDDEESTASSASSASAQAPKKKKSPFGFRF